jgi:hypothetical protein
MTTTVRIAWTWKGPNDELWNSVAARAVEQFELPGGRYTCRACIQGMDYIFVNEKDAIMFSLEHGGSIVSEQQKTVEFVSNML